MITLFVDYNRIGHAERFSLNLTGPERDRVAAGDTVRLVGDGVEPATGRVESVDAGGRAEVTILTRAAQPAR